MVYRGVLNGLNGLNAPFRSMWYVICSVSRCQGYFLFWSLVELWLKSIKSSCEWEPFQSTIIPHKGCLPLWGLGFVISGHLSFGFIYRSYQTWMEEHLTAFMICWKIDPFSAIIFPWKSSNFCSCQFWLPEGSTYLMFTRLEGIGMTAWPSRAQKLDFRPLPHQQASVSGNERYWCWEVEIDHPMNHGSFNGENWSPIFFWMAFRTVALDTLKSSILIGFSLINHPFRGTPIYGNPQVGKMGDIIELPWCPKPCFCGKKTWSHPPTPTATPK